MHWILSYKMKTDHKGSFCLDLRRLKEIIKVDPK